MNRILKTLSAIIISLTIAASANASVFSNIIEKSPLDKTSTIAVSIKNANNGKTIYEYNQEKLLHPASTLKLFTLKASYDTLGENYQFKTGVYKDNKKNLYLKLGADPTLTSAALTDLFKTVKSKNISAANDIVIDPEIIDNIQWGVGWMWDDDTSMYLPKISPFSINNNLAKIVIKPGSKNSNPTIKNYSDYPFVLVNVLKNGDKNNIEIFRQPWINSDLVYLKGTIKSDYTFQLPINNTKDYFVICVEKSIKNAGINYKGSIKIAPTPPKTTLVAETTSAPIENIVGDALKNSNNYYTELIFKAAGAKFKNSQGTTQNGIEMFKSYYSTLKAANPDIVDASGASRNDLITANWMTDALNFIYKQENFKTYEPLIAKPVEGTLSDRLLNISQNLRAKTGSISGVSTLTGYVTSKSGTPYSFAILIQNFDIPSVDVKRFEDTIVNAIYNY